MTAEEKKTIEMIRQIREAVEAQTLPLQQFPLEDLENLIRATVGMQFVGIDGGMKKEEFKLLVDGYLRLIQHCVEVNDVMGCVRALILLEEQYSCMDLIFRAFKMQKNTNRYKVLATEVAKAYCNMQYIRKHSNNRELFGSWQNGKGAIYTCSVHSNTALHQPEYISVNWDYICFTDKEEKWGTKEGVWEYRKLEMAGIKDKKQLVISCMLKPYLILPEYDYSIWVRPDYKIVGELELLFESYWRNNSFLGFPSYHKDDVYSALTTGMGNDDENISIRRKKVQYEKEGYPAHYGMISNGVMIRNHRDEKLKAVMETWWEEGLQCERLWEHGFTYAAWKHDFDFALCDLFVEMNSYFKNMELDLEVRKIE